MRSLSKRAAARGIAVAVSTVLSVGCFVALSLPQAAMAAPEPSPIPKRWQLDITTSPLMTTVVDGKQYYFLTYRVTNNSAQDLLFAPAFELSTDDADLLRSGREVPFDVTREIMDRLANPMLEDQIGIVGTLLRGPENAKQGVVIWPVPQRHQAEVAVFCSGFSGETATVEVPSASNPDKMEKKLLRKTWMMRFRLPGDLTPSAEQSFEPEDRRWIMR